LGQQRPSYPIRPKLTVGPANDSHEQEADRIAAQVVGQMNAPQSQSPAAGLCVQRQQKSEDEKLLSFEEIS
jgi:hypothetical protein